MGRCRSPSQKAASVPAAALTGLTVARSPAAAGRGTAASASRRRVVRIHRRRRIEPPFGGSRHPRSEEDGPPDAPRVQRSGGREGESIYRRENRLWSSVLPLRQGRWAGWFGISSRHSCFITPERSTPRPPVRPRKEGDSARG